MEKLKRRPVFGASAGSADLDQSRSAIADHFAASAEAAQKAAADPALIASCRAIAEACVAALRAGGKLLFAGNGGSAADAQHIAGEFLSRLNFDRAPLPAVALTVDTSVITAIGNDYGFERIFERQARALTRPGDIFVGLSTSGRSANVLAALRAAREMGGKTIGFTGAGGAGMAPLCDLLLVAPSAETPLIQQIHITAAHAICGAVEAALFGKAG